MERNTSNMESDDYWVAWLSESKKESELNNQSSNPLGHDAVTVDINYENKPTYVVEYDRTTYDSYHELNPSRYGTSSYSNIQKENNWHKFVEKDEREEREEKEKIQLKSSNYSLYQKNHNYNNHNTNNNISRWSDYNLQNSFDDNYVKSIQNTPSNARNMLWSTYDDGYNINNNDTGVDLDLHVENHVDVDHNISMESSDSIHHLHNINRVSTYQQFHDDDDDDDGDNSNNNDSNNNDNSNMKNTKERIESTPLSMSMSHLNSKSNLSFNTTTLSDKSKLNYQNQESFRPAVRLSMSLGPDSSRSQLIYRQLSSSTVAALTTSSSSSSSSSSYYIFSELGKQQSLNQTSNDWNMDDINLNDDDAYSIETVNGKSDDTTTVTHSELAIKTKMDSIKQSWKRNNLVMSKSLIKKRNPIIGLDIGAYIQDILTSLLQYSSMAAGNLVYNSILTIKENPWVVNATGCASEMILFSAERARYLTEVTSHTITSDDPETQYLNYLRDGLEGGDWKDLLRLRSRHATLKLEQRQLIQDVNVDYHGGNSILTQSSQQQLIRKVEVGNNDDHSDDRNEILERKEVIDISSLVQKASKEEQSITSTLVDGYDVEHMDEKDDTSSLDSAEEASYVLTRIFVPPRFTELKECFICQQIFGLTRYRHHCRNCGNSVCNNHSTHRRRILNYGITVPVRVCDTCVKVIDKVVLDDAIVWRKARVTDYLSGCLRPYRPPLVDRHVDKVFRVTDYSIQLLRKTLFLSYPAMIALETLDILKRYGISGLAGVMLREDFIEAVETLKSISGMDKTYPISLHELTACIYYKLAINRGIRGCMPEEEHICHSPSTPYPSSSSSSTPEKNPSVETMENPEEVEEDDLDDALRFAPLTLKAVYAESIVECQRLGWLQGWELIYGEFTSAPEQPAYALFATDVLNDLASAASRKVKSDQNVSGLQHGRGQKSNQTDIHSKSEEWKKGKHKKTLSGRKEAVLVIRGTNSVHDVVTDIRATPIEFPLPVDDMEISDAISYSSSSSTTRDFHDSFSQKKNQSNSKDAWILLTAGKNYACGGMVRAALWLYETVGPSLIDLHNNQCDIIITGHSLGGGVASLLTYLLKGTISTIRCVTYGCPCCMTAEIADELKERVLTVVLHDDVISRLTPVSIRLLLKELMVFRGKVFYNGSVYQHLQSDWNDIIERAGSLWSPRWREIHPKGIGIQTQTNETSEDNYIVVSQEKVSIDIDSNVVTPTPTPTASTSHVLRSNHSNPLIASRENNSPIDPNNSNDDNSNVITDEDECEIIDEDKILDIWLPGRIMHIYSHRGQYKAMIVGRNFPSLRRIEVQSNIFHDHSSESIINALREVVAVRQSSVSVPPYQSFDSSDVCHCCKNKFTWHSTFRNKPQEYREKHNCHHCGLLVCGPCSSNKYPIAKYGLIFPNRICDACLSKGNFVMKQ